MGLNKVARTRPTDILYESCNGFGVKKARRMNEKAQEVEEILSKLDDVGVSPEALNKLGDYLMK